MPSRAKRSKGLAARQAGRPDARTAYASLVEREAGRTDLVRAALAQLADGPDGDADARDSMTAAVELVGRGMPVAEAAELFGLDRCRLGRAVRQAAGPAGGEPPS